MKKFSIAVLLILNATSNLPAQNKKLTCLDLKTGIFHSYSKNGSEHFISRREADYQYDNNLTKGDTSVWKINWTDDCTYSLKFVSGTGFDEATLKILKKHKLAYEITKVTGDYCVYKGYLDNVSGTLLESDTMWLAEKTTVSNNVLFTQLPSDGLLKRHHFGDTSRYAVLYIYRPGKLTNSLGNYIIYCNDNVMCVAKNKSGYIFKILKEGQISFKSKLFKDESSVTVDIKFGKKYYVKSMIHWGISSRLYNFKLEMALVTNETGAEEFDKVDAE